VISRPQLSRLANRRAAVSAMSRDCAGRRYMRLWRTVEAWSRESRGDALKLVTD
jgi:hypothetical protein